MYNELIITCLSAIRNCSRKKGILLFIYKLCIHGQKMTGITRKKTWNRNISKSFLWTFLNFIFRNRRSTSGHPRAAVLRVARPRCSERAGRRITHHQLESGGSGSTRLPTSRPLEPVGRRLPVGLGVAGDLGCVRSWQHAEESYGGQLAWSRACVSVCPHSGVVLSLGLISMLLVNWC